MGGIKAGANVDLGIEDVDAIAIALRAHTQSRMGVSMPSHCLITRLTDRVDLPHGRLGSTTQAVLRQPSSNSRSTSAPPSSSLPPHPPFPADTQILATPSSTRQGLWQGEHRATRSAASLSSTVSISVMFSLLPGFAPLSELALRTGRNLCWPRGADRRLTLSAMSLSRTLPARRNQRSPFTAPPLLSAWPAGRLPLSRDYRRLLGPAPLYH